jgi:hypothetical protein
MKQECTGVRVQLQQRGLPSCSHSYSHSNSNSHIHMGVAQMSLADLNSSSDQIYMLSTINHLLPTRSFFMNPKMMQLLQYISQLTTGISSFFSDRLHVAKFLGRMKCALCDHPTNSG